MKALEAKETEAQQTTPLCSVCLKETAEFINGIENFWEYAKHRLSKFKGIKKENFLLHLKECEFRYNNSKDTKTFYHILLKMIRENPLKFN